MFIGGNLLLESKKDVIGCVVLRKPGHVIRLELSSTHWVSKFFVYPKAEITAVHSPYNGITNAILGMKQMCMNCCKEGYTVTYCSPRIWPVCS